MLLYFPPEQPRAINRLSLPHECMRRGTDSISATAGSVERWLAEGKPSGILLAAFLVEREDIVVILSRPPANIAAL